MNSGVIFTIISSSGRDEIWFTGGVKQREHLR